MVRDVHRLATRHWAGTIAAIVLLAIASLLVPAAASWRAAAAATFDQDFLERRAEAAVKRWSGEQDEPDDEPANVDNVGPADAHDGVYAGTATMRAAIHVVTFKVRVANGVGSGTQSRLDCGVAPLALRISPSGKVSGMVLIFGSTCLKTELAIRGQAVGGTLLLRIGNQPLELAKLD
jgi:hypothetical protein